MSAEQENVPLSLKNPYLKTSPARLKQAHLSGYKEILTSTKQFELVTVDQTAFFMGIVVSSIRLLRTSNNISVGGNSLLIGWLRTKKLGTSVMLLT